MDAILLVCNVSLDSLDLVSEIELMKIISGMSKTVCATDPFSTKLLMAHLPTIIHILLHIVNLCLSTGVFLTSYKSSIVIPLTKKAGLHHEILENYRPVSNLSFLSKVIEKIIANRILTHISENGIVDLFQSAYKAGHSCETAYYVCIMIL